MEHIFCDVHPLDSLHTRLDHRSALCISFEFVDELFDVLYFLKLVLTLFHLVAIAVSLRLFELVKVAGVVG